MNFVVRLIISTLAILITSYILPGVSVDNFLTAILVSVVLSLLNAFIKPLLIIFTLPAVIFSFGLFLIVINTFIILLVDKLVDGFRVNGFWWALLFSFVLWLVTSVFNKIQEKDNEEL